MTQRPSPKARCPLDQRRKIKALVPSLARLLLEDGPDADIEAYFDKHSEVSQADLRQVELAQAGQQAHLKGA